MSAPIRDPSLSANAWRFHGRRPETDWGTWSFRLVGSGLALLVATVALVAVTGVHANVGPVSLLGVLALGALAEVIVGGAVAIVAILRLGERSVAVLATLPLWVLAMFLVVGELAVPH